MVCKEEEAADYLQMQEIEMPNKKEIFGIQVLPRPKSRIPIRFPETTTMLKPGEDVSF